ncbi:hypothetical protein ACHWQZ_G015704 [Mnemiopsis leidyi]
MLSLNGYSKNFTYSIINKELEKRLSGVEKPVYEGPDRLKVYMKLPYIGDMSSKVKECIKKGLSGKFELILSNKYSKLNQKFTFKDRQPKHLKSDLVYEIKCSCGRRYVGETCRALKTRFDEHMKTEGSNMTEVGKHLHNNPSCKVTFEDCRVLTYESNQYRRKLKESLYIQQFDDEREYKDIYPSASNIPVMYGLPKIHKTGAPLRPILSMVGCFNHAFAQWIGRQLGDLRQAKHITKDSFNLNFLKDSNLNGKYFVSYDVVSLFTNIPLDETIQLIVDSLYPKVPGVTAKDQLFHGMTKTIFRNALNHCLKDNTFVFDGIFYKQIDGCAMGSPLAPILADIFMNHLLEPKIVRGEHDFLNITFINEPSRPFNLHVFVRYVDNTLAVFDNPEEADRFLTYLNNLHDSIKFTIDKESNDKLPLLDLLLIKDCYYDEENISITVYRKPTHSGVFTHFLSFIPFQYKRGLVRTLFDRAFKICSSWNLFHIEMENIVRMLSLNGYSKNFTYSIINKELEKRLSGVEKPVYEGPDRLKVYMKLPYIGDMSSKVKECIKKGLSGKFELILSNKYSKLNQKFTFKDRQPKHLKSDLVYEIKCSCGRRYVGETCRALKTRFDEHMKTEGSNMTEVGKHLHNNPSCKVTFEDCRVLTYESNQYRRKLKESLYIQQFDDGTLINDKLASVPLFLFSLPSYQDQQKGRIFPSF